MIPILICRQDGPFDARRRGQERGGSTEVAGCSNLSQLDEMTKTTGCIDCATTKPDRLPARAHAEDTKRVARIAKEGNRGSSCWRADRGWAAKTRCAVPSTQRRG